MKGRLFTWLTDNRFKGSNTLSLHTHLIDNTKTIPKTKGFLIQPDPSILNIDDGIYCYDTIQFKSKKTFAKSETRSEQTS